MRACVQEKGGGRWEGKGGRRWRWEGKGGGSEGEGGEDGNSLFFAL